LPAHFNVLSSDSPIDAFVFSRFRVLSGAAKLLQRLAASNAFAKSDGDTMRNSATPPRILVVGGSSGMGLALAEHCLADGAAVTIVGRSEARLSAARQRLPHPERLQTVVADVTRETDVARLFETVGTLDHIACTAADVA
jgi:FlaA1/EpsC-like NDP-sugar epimerase